MHEGAGKVAVLHGLCHYSSVIVLELDREEVVHRLVEKNSFCCRLSKAENLSYGAVYGDDFQILAPCFYETMRKSAEDA